MKEDINDKYSYTLEGLYGPLLRPVLGSLFSRINIPELYKTSISSLASEGHIVYTHSTKSLIDAMLLNYRLEQHDLPVPKIIFGHSFILLQPVYRLWKIFTGLFNKKNSPFHNGFYQQYIVRRDCASLIFLDKKPLKPGQDPILELLKIQRELNTPIYLVPQRLVYRRMPLKIKDAAKEENAQIKVFRKIITLARAEEHGFIEHGEPINLMDTIKHALAETKLLEETAVEVRNKLTHRLAALSSNISGAPIRERSFIIKKTVKDPILQTFISTHSMENHKAGKEVERTVYKYLEQIASNLSPSVINFLNRTLTWIFNNIFDGLDVNEDGIDAVREVARNGSLVYVPCHKSHIDYLLLSLCLFQHWMSVPVIAAGINLAFFPIGHLLRGGGAFFMKRSFRNNPIYAQTFAAYVRTILQERIPLEFFIEGGRSRSGKLMLPKKGLLSMIIQGWESGVSRDVIFVPVYVGYDTVVEEKSYIREMKGAPKEKESVWQLIKAGKVLKNRYGKVYIRFAKPISLNRYMKGKTSYSQMDQDQKELFYDDFAQKIIGSIYQQSVATPFSVLSCVLISRASAMEEDIAKDTFHIFVDYLKSLDYNTTPSLLDEKRAFIEAFSILKNKGLIDLDEGEGEDDANLITVNPEDRIHLEYYKNTVLNFFVPAALIANVIIRYPEGIDEKVLNEQVRSLSTLLEKEFILEMKSFERAFEYLLGKKIIVKSKGIYSIDSNMIMTATMFAGLIENYLESYLCVAEYLKKTKKPGKKDILKVINKHSTRMFKKGEITRYEALCLPAYKGALDTFKAKGLIDDSNRIEDKAAIQDLIDEINAYLED